MADEMGICVLAETGIWSSDGGPKIDSDLYWEACRSHVKGMILRDRNYPSVFGWSVCNETLPVTHNVFKAPKELMDKNIQEINNWVAIAKATDPTRDWISGDGETDAETDLPTIIGHYGGETSQRRWASYNSPWGIGETGMAYYGTPLQVSKINGDRAYESQLGRMEGLAGEAFGLISTQREMNASYTSVFNLAWYGLKPLALGLNDVSRPYVLEDGIFFDKYKEGKSGYQPERLGAYASTFNPGYDPTLPLYETWPLFDAIKAAYSDNYSNIENHWKQVKDNTVTAEKYETKSGVVWLSDGTNEELKERFESIAIVFEALNANENQLIVFDGANPPLFDTKIVENLKSAVQNGSTLVFWGATKDSKEFIEALTGNKIEFYKREATSYIIKGEHAMLNGESNSNFYFSETTKNPVSELSIGGDWAEKSQLILEACNTNWQKWNYQGEPVKTAKVIRSEREAKATGNVVVRDEMGKGEILVSTLDLFSMGTQIVPFVNAMFENLGAPFKGQLTDVADALNSDYVLQNALFLGSFRLTEEANDPFSIESEYVNIKRYGKVNDLYWMIANAGKDGVFDIKQMKITQKDWAFAYLSFWVYSPRSLTDLLIEPNMPRVDMRCKVEDPFAVYINGKKAKEYRLESDWANGEVIFEGVPLAKGWNHVLLKVAQTTQDWKTKFSFSSTKPEFLKELKTTVDK
jgi:beta-galactosidase